jgi:hypothetical protein
MTRARDVANIDGILTTKGDIYAATAVATPARLGVGNDGETLVADSSTSTGLRYNAAANQNLLANGAFDIWQRGVGPFTSNVIYTTDRWFVYSSTSYSLTQETSVIPTGATNAVKMTSTAGSSFCNLQQVLEQSDVEKLAGKTVTFSVYLRANATYNGATVLQINYSTTGNSQIPTWVQAGGSAAITPSTSGYVRYSATATIPTTAKGVAFMIAQQSVLASGSILYAALAKAEIGTLATEFVRVGGSLQADLAACQRYYYRITPSVTNGAFSVGNNYSTTINTSIIYPKVTLRTTPTLETSGTASHYKVNTAAGAVTCSSVPVIDQTSTDIIALNATVASGLTVGNAGLLVALNGGTSILAFSAEL